MFLGRPNTEIKMQKKDALLNPRVASHPKKA
jgi:hypothetical protein